MLVELAGCSSSGKTSLLHATVAELERQGRRVLVADQLMAQAARIAWVKNPTARNVGFSVFLTGWFRRGAKRNPSFAGLARAHVIAHATSRFDRASRLAALRRQIAVDALLRDRHPESLTVIDEGILGAIHSALVHVTQPATMSDVEELSQWMPKPDLVIHLDTPLSVCLQRALARPDPPLRWSTPIAVERFVRHGHEAYRLAGRSSAFRSRWHSLTPAAGADPSALAREVVSLLQKENCG